jgi:hypothetical protein
MTLPDHIQVTFSAGRSKYGQRYAYVRPARKCCNRSWRCPEDLVHRIIERHFPVVRYYRIDGHTIGARNAEAALKEYWRVCEKGKIGARFEINIL